MTHGPNRLHGIERAVLHADARGHAYISIPDARWLIDELKQARRELDRLRATEEERAAVVRERDRVEESMERMVDRAIGDESH